MSHDVPHKSDMERGDRNGTTEGDEVAVGRLLTAILARAVTDASCGQGGISLDNQLSARRFLQTGFAGNIAAHLGVPIVSFREKIEAVCRRPIKKEAKWHGQGGSHRSRARS